MELCIHRYNLRPGVDKLPDLLPNGTREISIAENRTIVYYNDPTYVGDDCDLDLFAVLNEYGDLFSPFYDALLAETDDEEIIQLIKAYNAAMDNINWLIRDESREFSFSIADAADAPQMTLYELNQQAYSNIAPKNEEEIVELGEVIYKFLITDVDNVAMTMLLCRELYDYTIFKKQTLIPLEESVWKIIDLLESRGPILDVHHNKDGHYLECWVRYKGDHTPHMYVFFDCTSFIVEY